MIRIGIDAGGSLIKVAYEEKGNLHVKTYAIEEKTALTDWLTMLAPNATLYGTGGKWPELSAKFQHRKQTVDEFTALVNGTKYLLDVNRIQCKEFILTSIGTGTSIFYVNENSFERVVGSGIGGGTWMGLGSLITNSNNFRELVNLAAKGNHQKSDLLVKDIYVTEQAPLLGDLTAANFGKAHLDGEITAADHAAALNQLIAEVILSLIGQVITTKDVQQLVFIGSTLKGNLPLQNAITSFQEILPFEAVFLDKGAYAGAIGALFD